jgi:hypothetical protein
MAISLLRCTNLYKIADFVGNVFNCYASWLLFLFSEDSMNDVKVAASQSLLQMDDIHIQAILLA